MEVFNVPNCFSVDTVENGFDLMDADGIFGRVQGLIDHIISDYPNVRAIGIDGQMHGILYLNAEGRAISSLVTWRDKRCDRLTEHSEATVGAESYCERISRMTGERIATGYGLATHYYNCQNGLVPEGCAGFCSIMDYAVMRLTDTHEPLLHASVAASLGFYDVASGRFKADKLRRLFGDDLKLPKVTKKLEGRGKYRGIPVCVAIGDNQASFLGSVGDHEKSVLVNIGTGSQISMASSDTVEAEGVEIRPLLEESCLVCGSALCGGSAYAMLERFFSAYAEQLGARELSQYSVMNSLALSAYDKRKVAAANGGVSRGITVRTEFAGTRAEPERRGGIDGIDMGNFTPENLTLGFIEGICRELLGLFENVDMSDRCSIVASGGAVQRIDVMKSVIADVFGMEVSVSSVREEASVGAALAAAYSAGLMKDERDIQMLAGKLAIRR
ncbi:MAG: hypothetical protein IJY04_04460 [Clostridia bacterium]|nr:hypothetical protein [Clostridia bacterium]